MVTSSSRPATVSRTSSASSIDFTANAFNPTEARRTRKRISTAQLAHLEELYRQSSHPTRDQRDALAKRIQMETKSVTIWFQNKRQTDRKVALHNTTNSRNVALPAPTSGLAPDITLTVPTSPAYPLGAPEQDIACRVSNDGIARRQPSKRTVHLKRTSSIASSVTSTSTTSTASTSKTRLSLDRVASRSEIRFTNRQNLTRKNSSVSLVKSSCATGLAPTINGSAPLPLSATTSSASLASLPESPPSAALTPLWETMLSSPLAPSSPPHPEYVAYARARKARTLDWACAAARLTAPEPAPPSWPGSVKSASLLGPAFSTTKARDVAARTREYEEATSMTEDEAELITPHGSQDASIPWSGLQNNTNTFSKPSSDPMDVTDNIEQMDIAYPSSVDSRGWEEDEMHAALALCGLKG